MDETAGLDKELLKSVDEVLAADNSLVLAARRLLDFGDNAIREISHGVQLPGGLGRDLVYRCIAVRAQETLASILQLIEIGASQHARVLLRPLTEDHIFLGWLRTLDDDVAGKFITLRAMLDIVEGYEAQGAFLQSAYSSLGVEPVPPQAPGLQLPSMEQMGEEVQGEFKELGKQFGWQRRGPSVKAMAEAAGRTSEYEFFYLASSRSVHSNLHEMGRMVWGDPSSTRMTISSDKLMPLHTQFALTYGVWLYSEVLSELSTEFPRLRELVDSQAWSVWLALVLVGMARNGRLPPIVTEEELRPPTG